MFRKLDPFTSVGVKVHGHGQTQSRNLCEVKLDA